MKFTQGVEVVLDNAPNSHRDGAAKYSAGSVEELLSRYTDSALKMALHFSDVHQRNQDCGYSSLAENPIPLDVDDYQRRYLKMVLTICAKLLKKNERYLETEEFFDDLFDSYPNESSGLPIYFDLQNNAYEVPVNGGFISEHWFTNTKKLNTVEGIFQTRETIPVKIVSYAAPDLRQIETSPLDARATSNKVLQHPAAEGNLGCMLSAGIALQCQEAIALAKKYKQHSIEKPVAVVFIMPGCGAFKNPEKSTVAHFISTIQYFCPKLHQQGIHCYVAEFNSKLHNLLVETSWKFDSRLGELNCLINAITVPSVRKQTIAVRERIVNLIQSEGYTEELKQHLSLTIELLKSKPGLQRNAVVEKYKAGARDMQKNSNLLWKALGSAMIALGLTIAASGIVVSATALGLGIGMGIAVGGTLLAGLGWRLFTHNKYNRLEQATTTLSDLAREDGKGELLPENLTMDVGSF